MKVSKFITISDCFRSHEFEVSVGVDHDDIRCAIQEDKDSESQVLRSFADFIRYSQAVPDEIYEGFNDAARKIIGENLSNCLRKIGIQTPCIWSKNPRDAELMDTGCEELHLTNVSNDRNFKFCPYCGNEIKLAESV